MGDYSIDLSQPIKVDGLNARSDGDGVFYSCPGCLKDVRISSTYRGGRDIVHVICHSYPCEWYDNYRAQGREERMAALLEKFKQAVEIFKPRA